MFRRLLLTTIAGCTFVCAPLAAKAAERGPSTPEERKQALEYIRDFEAHPLSPAAIREREWLLRWIADIPDVHVTVCPILNKLPRGDKKDSSSIFLSEMFSQTAFLLENSDGQNNRLAEYQAGVEGALRVYEALLKAKPKDRQTYLDELVEQRNAGTLSDFVKARVPEACRQ